MMVTCGHMASALVSRARDEVRLAAVVHAHAVAVAADDGPDSPSCGAA